MNNRSASTPPVYPLAALVGQEEMVQALLLLAVDPGLGGLVLTGDKGTAKSTAARGLAELLPPTGPGCRSAPFRTIPLGVTEDRLLGGLDWEGTLKNGRPVLQIGLLGEADGGLAYLDEANLLEPGLAHLILDAASTGRVVLEREGFSASYPARLALLATMNPEEGPLGPQLADRFALTVQVSGEPDRERRLEIVRRRLAFEADPEGFRQQFAAAKTALQERLARARRLLSRLTLTDRLQTLIGELVAAARPAGHRADLALARAARARAALGGQESVREEDIHAVAGLILPQRARLAPNRPVRSVKMERIEGSPQKVPEFEPVYVAEVAELPPEYRGGEEDGEDRDEILRLFKAGEVFSAVISGKKRDQGPRGRSGRRQAREVADARGRAYRTTARRLGRPLSLSATLRAAAPHQLGRRQRGAARTLVLTPADFREKVYRLKTGRLVIFVVDSSGSIGTLYRMEEAKAAALTLLTEAYQKRDRVALIAFYGQRAELLLPPTNSPDLAGRLLADLPSGGKTPLAAALMLTQQLLRRERARDPHLTPYVVLMTDGRPNIPLETGCNPWTEVLRLAGRMAEDLLVRFLLIDTDRGAYNDYKLTRDLAERLRAPRLSLEDLRAGKLMDWLENS